MDFNFLLNIAQEWIHNEYVQFFLILIGSIAFGKIFHDVLAKYFRRITERTKTDIDERILTAITKPLYVLIVFIGVYLSLRSLSVLSSYVSVIQKVFFVGCVAIISLILSIILSILVSHWIKIQKKYEKTPKLIRRLVSGFVYLVALVIVLSYFNVEVTPLIATLGIGGVVLGLAMQSTLSNFFAGIGVVSDKSVRIGDFVEIGNDLSGYVEDIGWRSIRIKTLTDNRVIIPNSKFADSMITNSSFPQHEMNVSVSCGVAYGSDLEKVEKVTLDVAKKIQKTVPGTVKSFEPFVRYNEFGDSNINFSVNLRVEHFVDKYLVRHEFIKALKKAYDKEKIEISWPIRKIYQRK